jgi:hypothetical protein
MREDAAEQYLSYKLIDSNQDWNHHRVHLLTMIRVMKANGTRWGKPLGVAAQPPLSKSFWRRWSARPLLLRRAQSPQLLLQKKW